MFTTYLSTCPVCGWERNVQADIEDSPDYWRQHLEDRETGYAPKIGRSNIDTVIDQIMQDGNVEHIPLSKLKDTRKKGK
jgi:hypothetical protein